MMTSNQNTLSSFVSRGEKWRKEEAASHALLSEGLVAQANGIYEQRRTPISRLSEREFTTIILRRVLD